MNTIIALGVGLDFPAVEFLGYNGMKIIERGIMAKYNDYMVEYAVYRVKTKKGKEITSLAIRSDVLGTPVNEDDPDEGVWEPSDFFHVPKGALLTKVGTLTVGVVGYIDLLPETLPLDLAWDMNPSADLANFHETLA